jgi:RimJ/RimL family protein N-acetyltransferase
MYEHKDGINFRKIEASDLPALLELKRESWWGTHKSLIINSEDQRRWFESIPSDQLFLIAETRWDNGWEPCGVAVYTNIDMISRTLQIAGSIYKAFRKTETVKNCFSGGLDFGFEMLNMQRIEAEVLEYNVPSQQLEIDHLGFTVEGRRRRAVYKCGRYYDSIQMGLLREEWEAQPRVKAYGDTCNKNFSHDKMERLSKRFSRVTDAASASQ